MPRLNERYLVLYLGLNGLISIRMAMHEFTLATDHCPLCTLFGPIDGVCSFAAATVSADS